MTQNQRTLRIAFALLLGAVAMPLWGCQSNSKPVDTLLQELSQEDWLVRRNATEALGKAGSKAIPALRQALAHAQARVRIHAAESLAIMGNQAHKALPDLVGLLKDKSVFVRRRAAEAIGNIGPAAKTTIPTLVDLLKDHDSQVRLEVVQALAHIDPKLKSTATVLQYRLQDPSPLVVLAAAKALGQYPVEKNNEEAKKEASKHAQLAIAALIGILQHKDPWLRANAAYTLGQLKENALPAASALIDALQDSHPIVRQNAADSLGEIGKDVTKNLTPLLKHNQARIRYYAVYAIGKVGVAAKNALPMLETYLKTEKDSLVKNEFLRAINRLKGKSNK